MKMRLVLALVAVAAVVCWLAVPAIRIWRDPSTLQHVHELSSPMGKVSHFRFELPIVAATTRCQGEAVKLTHHAPFARRYWSMLLGRRWSDPSACSLEPAVFIDAVLDDPKPPRYGDTLIKGLATLLSRSRSKAASPPPK